MHRDSQEQSPVNGLGYGNLSSDDDVEEEQQIPEKKWQPRLITIEPVLFLYLFACGLQGPAVSALVYKKVCLHHYQDEICDNLHNGTNNYEEDVVQKETSHWQLWNNYCFEIPAIVVSFAYGACSDHVSRRVVIALPSVGQALSNVTYIVTAVFMESDANYLLIGALSAGVTGGWITLFLSSFSYLGEVTRRDDITHRVFIAEGVAGMSLAISYVLSGIILDHSSYLVVFSLSTAILILSIIYVFAYIKVPPKKPVVNVQTNESKASIYFKRFTEAFTVIFRKREGSNRARLIVGVLIVLFGMISLNAIGTVGFLFLKRRPLSWSQTTYGMFLAESRFLPSICLLTIIPLMKSKLHIRDTTFMMIGLISGALSEIYFSFCTKTWMVFLMPVIESFRGAGTVMRATLSQLVEPSELGRMYAALGSLQSVSGMVGATIYNTVYPRTIHFWPGFCFTLGAMISVIPLTMICWFHRNVKTVPPYLPLPSMELNGLTGEDVDANVPLVADEENEVIDEWDLGEAHPVKDAQTA